MVFPIIIYTITNNFTPYVKHKYKGDYITLQPPLFLVLKGDLHMYYKYTYDMLSLVTSMLSPSSLTEI